MGGGGEREWWWWWLPDLAGLWDESLEGVGDGGSLLLWGDFTRVEV